MYLWDSGPRQRFTKGLTTLTEADVVDAACVHSQGASLPQHWQSVPVDRIPEAAASTMLTLLTFTENPSHAELAIALLHHAYRPLFCFLYC